MRHFARHHKEEPVAALLEALERDPRDTGTLRRVADEHGVSVRTLRTDFKEQVGSSVHVYQTRRRVEFAVRRLSATTEKVESVAHDAGWSSRKDMGRAIRQVTGYTPTQIRQQADRD